jgi:hypothetical protein
LRYQEIKGIFAYEAELKSTESKTWKLTKIPLHHNGDSQSCE